MTTLARRPRKRRKGSERRRMRWSAGSGASLRLATRATGFLKRSENSLNQHIKLKHAELWSKFKNPETATDGILGEKKNGFEDRDIKF